MTPTSPRSLIVAAAVAAPVGWMLARLWDIYGQGLPEVSWITVGLLAFLAVLLLVLARSVRGWVQERRHDRRMGPLVVSRLVALAKAAAMCGAAVVGGYLGLGLVLVQAQVDPGRLLRPALAVLAGAAVVAAGLVLERSCRVPRQPDEDRAA